MEKRDKEDGKILQKMKKICALHEIISFEIGTRSNTNQKKGKRDAHPRGDFCEKSR